MNTSLRRILCLAIGLAIAPAAPGFGQELEFRAVPRPTTPATPAAPAPAAVTTSGVVPASFKLIEDTPNFVAVGGDPMKTPDLKAPAPLPMPTQAAPPGVNTVVPRPMPGNDWVGPAPQIMPGPGPGMMVTQPTIVSQPTIVGQPTVIGPGGSSYSGMHGGMPYVVGHGVGGGGDCGCNSCGNSCGTCCDPCNSCSPCGDSCGMQLLRSPHALWNHLFGGNDCCAPPLIDCCDPCGTCNCCGPRSMFWVRGEYLVYSMTRQNAPPLVTTAPTIGQLPLGAGSAVAFDGSDLPHSPFSGGKFSMGFWFSQHSDWGLDVTAFFLSQRQTNFNASSNGSFALGRPFFETSTAPAFPLLGLPAAPTNTNQAEITAGPGAGTGSVNILAQTRAWGIDPDIRRKLWCGPTWWVDGLIGYRFFRLDDDITITEDIRPDPALGNAQRIVVQDHFATRNTFNGFQLGLDGEWHFRPRWSLGATVKVAVGDLNQQIMINGSTVATNPNVSFPVGFFALPSNIGQFRQNQFSVLPEFGLRLNFDVTEHLRIYAGYNGMYLANVVRAGEQIDTRINSSQAPIAGTPGVFGPPLPAVLFKKSDFWAQGVSAGLEYHY